MVYVLSNTGRPLMPTENHRMVRRLLKSKKARVARHTPFTIQMLIPVRTCTQNITLGIDAGSKTIGISASTEQKELFSAEFYPRNDVTNLMTTRRELRRSRRSRKTRYRAPRFQNRIHSKPKGWVAPSIRVKIHNHEQAVKLVVNILPITKIIIETAEFDTQRLAAMENGKPLPVGTDYQLGEMYNFYNAKQYVLHRDDYQCQCCHIKSTPKRHVKFHVHHIISRANGGSNRPENLITLCIACHEGYHKGLLKLPGITKRPKSYRDAAFMTTMRSRLIEYLKTAYPDIKIEETKGYITKYIRESHGLLKSHTIDALCIARHPTAEQIDMIFKIKPIRSHNRQIHKQKILKGGIRKKNQAPKEVFGFRLFDKVKYETIECFIFSRRTRGAFTLKRINDNKIKDGVSYKQLRLLEHANSYIVQKQERKPTCRTERK